MRVVALGTGVRLFLTSILGCPFPGPLSVGAKLPVIVNEAVTTSTKLFGEARHNCRIVIGCILVAVYDMVTIVAALIIAMVDNDIGMGKTGVAGLVASRNGHPICMAYMAVADY